MDPPGACAESSVEVVDVDDAAYVLTLRVRGYPGGLTSGVRRIAMAEVPSFAFHDVVEEQNTGALQTERVRDRLALVPVIVPGVDVLEAERMYRSANAAQRKTLAIRFVLRDECHTQADCSRGCTYRQTTAASLQWMPRTAGESTRPPALRPRPVYSGMPITNLPIGSSICLYVVCIPGTGALHSKWSPVCPCTCVSAEPQAMCLPAQDDGAVPAAEADAPVHQGTYAGEARAQQGPASQHAPEADVLFTVETTGALTPAETLNYAVRVFLRRIDTLLAAFAEPAACGGPADE